MGDKDETRNLILAIALSMLVIIGWYALFPPPEPAPPPKSEGEKAVAEMFSHWERFMQLGREMQDAQMQMMRTLFEDAARQMANAAPEAGAQDKPQAPKDEG